MRLSHVEGVLKIEVSPRSCSVVGFRLPGHSHSESTARSSIKVFSVKSASRLRRYLINCTSKYVTSFTLTLPSFDLDGRLFKERFDVFAKSLQRSYPVGFSLCWVLEFTQKGIPHLHCLFTHRIPYGYLAYLWAEVWSGFVSDTTYCKMIHASCRIEAVVDYEQSVHYLSYLYKESQKAVPDGFSGVGRFWGVRGIRSVVAADTFEIPFFHVTSEGLFADMKVEVRRVCDALEGHTGLRVSVAELETESGRRLLYGSTHSYGRRDGMFSAAVYYLRKTLFDFYVRPGFVPLLFSVAPEFDEALEQLVLYD